MTLPEWRRWQSPGAGPGTQTVIWNTNTAGKSNGTQIRDFFLRTNFSSQWGGGKWGRSHEFSLSQFTKSTVLVFLFYVGFCLAEKEKKSIDGIGTESQVGAGRRATGSLRFRWLQVPTNNHQPWGLSEPCNFSSLSIGISRLWLFFRLFQLFECMLLLRKDRRKGEKYCRERCFVCCHWLSLVVLEYHWLSLIIIDCLWLSLIIIDYHWLSMIFIEYMKIWWITDWQLEIKRC